MVKKGLSKKTLRNIAIAITIVAILIIIGLVIYFVVFDKEQAPIPSVDDEPDEVVVTPPEDVTPEPEDPTPIIEGCYKENWKSGGSHISTNTKIPSAKMCQALCQDNAECNAFDWDSNRNYCYLRRNMGSGSALSGWISGHKVCQDGEIPDEEVPQPVDECVKTNWKHTGPHIKTISKTDTVGKCQKYCQEDGECTHFAWDGNRNYCMLKSGTGSGIKSDGWVSGSKLCESDVIVVEDEIPDDIVIEEDDIQTDRKCFEDGVKAGGSPITTSKATITKVTDTNTCQKLCQDETSCNHFDFDSNRNYCYLRQKKGSNPTPTTGWTNGPKNCPSFTIGLF